jgi:CRISPR-associated protein Cst2
MSMAETAPRIPDGRWPSGVAIAARVELTAHALNNEGSRNNATIPRQVDVIAGDDVVQVNAISGDTLKHAFVDHLRALVLASHAKDPAAADLLPLCGPCRQGDPNRLNADAEFQALARDSQSGNEAVLDALIQRCVIDDIAGLLVTQGNRNAPRRSVVQFGWTVGIPERVRTGRYTHVKLVPGAPDVESSEGSNLGQNIFTRPASSGAYAFIGLVDLARLGVNDLSRRAAIADEARQARGQLALEALYLTLAAPGGAQRNTQLPHLSTATGTLCVSFSSVPPVLVSPLAADFVDQMARTAGAFGRLGDDLVVMPFTDLPQLGSALAALAGRG